MSNTLYFFDKGTLYRISPRVEVKPVHRNKNTKSTPINHADVLANSIAPSEKPKEFSSWLEARRAPRKPCDLSVDYATENRIFHDRITDISTSGAFIETNQKFDVGELVYMTIQIVDQKTPLKMKAEIVRQTPAGIGVEFRLNRST